MGTQGLRDAMGRAVSRWPTRRHAVLGPGKQCLDVGGLLEERTGEELLICECRCSQQGQFVSSSAERPSLITRTDDL